MSDPLDTIKTIASRVLNTSAEELDVDLPIEDLGFDDEEWRDMLEEAATHHGIPIIDLVNTMPIYRLKRSDLAMNSLVDLAAFSPRAATMLDDFSTKMHINTLRSLAESISAGRYQSSGLMTDNLHEPNTPRWVIGKFTALSAAAFGVPLFSALGPCNPMTRYCFGSKQERFWDFGVLTLTPYALALCLWFGPGIYEICHSNRKQRARNMSGRNF